MRAKHVWGRRVSRIRKSLPRQRQPQPVGSASGENRGECVQQNSSDSEKKKLKRIKMDTTRLQGVNVAHEKQLCSDDAVIRIFIRFQVLGMGDVASARALDATTALESAGR